MKRRSFVTGSLFAGAGFVVGGACGGAPAVRPARTVTPTGSRRGDPTDLVAMAETIRESSRDEVSDLALRWAEAGASGRDLLGAGYLAGLSEINPSPIGGQVHALMMMASAASTATMLRGDAQLLPVLFHLDRVKRSQARDAAARTGDWIMPPAPEVDVGPVADHVRALDAAMVGWDEERGDRAVVALHEALPMDACFERLWPWAARDFRVIGHKIIFAVQTYRALQEIGWRHGRDAVRSLALGVLDRDPYGSYSAEESAAILALCDTNRRRAAGFPAAWAAGDADPDASLSLLAELRRVDADGAGELVATSIGSGVSAASVWDGLRLYAFELTMQRPSIAGVHTVTAVNALHRAAQITTVDSTRRLCLLQAAAWLPLFRPLLESRAQGPRDTPIDGLGKGLGRVAKDPFARQGVDFVFEDHAREAVGFVSASGSGRGVDGFVVRSMELLARKADNDHDYKFTVAAAEEIGHAHPRCQPLLAAAAMAMLKTAAHDDGAVYRAVRGRLDLEG